jgi:hypothetical protein
VRAGARARCGGQEDCPPYLPRSVNLNVNCYT